MPVNKCLSFKLGRYWKIKFKQNSWGVLNRPISANHSLPVELLRVSKITALIFTSNFSLPEFCIYENCKSILEEVNWINATIPRDDGQNIGLASSAVNIRA